MVMTLNYHMHKFYEFFNQVKHIDKFGGTLPSPGRNLEPTIIPRSVSFASKLTNSVNHPTNAAKPERAFVTSTKRQNEAFAYVIDSVDTTSQPGSISSCFSGSHGNLLKLKQSRERNKINRSRTVGEADYKRKVSTDFNAPRGHSFSCAAPSNGKLTIDDDLCSLENSEIYTAVSLAGTLTRNAAPSKYKWRWNKYKKLYVIIGVMGVLLVISTTAAVVLAILRC
ncbi:uncharacterized protein LOC100181317 [Ciona intestinalis]